MKQTLSGSSRGFLTRMELFHSEPPLPCRIARPGRAAWAVLAALGLFCLVSYCYTDLPLIVRHSLNLWQALGRGELFRFYQTATLLRVGQTHPQTGEVPYDIWVYLLLAVWNLPVYVWELLSGKTLEMSFLALLWARLGLMLPFAGCFWALRGIAAALGRSPRQAEWACFGFAGSLFLLNGLFCIGQIDIFSVFFTLMGLREYLRRSTAGFIGWFALVVTFKMFGLFAFLPLLLLAEKRPLYIVGHTLAGCSLSLVSKLLFFRDKMATPTQFDERRFLRFLLAGRIETGSHIFSVTVLLFGALLLFCWLARPSSGAQPDWAVWAMLAGYACMFLGGTTYPYWAVVLAPCAGLLLLVRPAQADGILLLELAASAGYWVYSLMRYSAVYGVTFNLQWMLIGRLFGASLTENRIQTLLAALSAGAWDNLQMLANSALLLGLGGLLVLAWPGRLTDVRARGEEESGVSVVVVWLRVGAAVFFGLLAAAACLLP